MFARDLSNAHVAYSTPTFTASHLSQHRKIQTYPLNMQTFHCRCPKRNRLFFDSVTCTLCGRMVGYCPELSSMLAFDPDAEAGLWQSGQRGQSGNPTPRWRQCQNYALHQVCNWMVPESDTNPLCRACRLNDVIPDLSLPINLEYWRKIERAKRHALYSILMLQLPLVSKHEDAARGLLFRFMTDREPNSEFTEPLAGQAPIFTGHDNGEITLNLAEADDIARTRMRIRLGEVYRTLLGHFRHEIGHYYWFRLIEKMPRRLEKFRQLFGDETIDYSSALQRHYSEGAPADWSASYISPYASMHPWEDWAECWAHYMHMLDTLETARAFHLSLGAPLPSAALPTVQRDGSTIGTLLKDWARLAIALNELNRSMGMPDPYPFILNNTVQMKLKFIHRIVIANNK